MNKKITKLPADTADVLSRILKCLPSDVQDAVVGELEPIYYQSGAVVYAANDVPTHIHLLLSGHVKEVLPLSSRRNRIMSLWRPGEAFGHHSLFLNTNYLCAAVAMTDAVIARLPAQRFLSLVAQYPPLAHHFLYSLSAQLAKSCGWRVMVTQKHVRGRLAETLLRMADFYGYEPDGQTIVLRPTRAEIANIANMTEANAIRTLSAFAAEGLISIYKRRIRLVDVPKLQEVSRLD